MERIANRYELQQRIGEGGMGKVYRALDRLSGQAVALKRVLLAPAETPTRPAKPGTQALVTAGGTLDYRYAIAQEFQLLASLRHPHIVDVMDYGFDEERHPYYTMHLLEGARTVTEYARHASDAERVRLFIDLLEALQYLHARGLLHRDLKPQNVLVDGDGQLYVVDFGLAHMVGQGPDDVLSGTLLFMAPEVVQYQQAVPQSDLYAAGLIAYEMWTGDYPFAVSSITQFIANLLTLEADCGRLPRGVGLIVERLLAKDPQDRYRDAQETIHALCAALERPRPVEDASLRDSYLQAATFVGREAELGRLRAALATLPLWNAPRDPSAPAAGRALLLAGESGVGKSRLLNELRTWALIEGAQVLRGQAAPDDLAYGPWRDPVRRLLLMLDPSDEEAAILREIIPDVGALLRRDVPPAPDLEGDARRERLEVTLLGLLRRITRPTVLILEDLHWSTESNLLLQRLASTLPATTPLLLLGSYRSDEAPELPQTLAAFDVLHLPRLTSDEIAALSASMLGETGRDEHVVDLIERETAGNTFFMVEVVRALAENAGSMHEIATATLPAQIFAGGVQAVLQTRLQRLADVAEPWSLLAAAAGRRLDLAVLRTAGVAAGMREAHAAAHLETWLTRAANTAIVEQVDERWQFAHDKIRAVVLESASPDEYRTAHARIAAAITTVHADEPAYAEALIRHYRAAHDPLNELLQCARAAEHLTRISVYGRAQTLLERGLYLLQGDALLAPDDTPVDTLLLEHTRLERRLQRLLGDVQARIGEFDNAEASYHAILADNPNDPATLDEDGIRARSGLAYVHLRRGQLLKAKRWAEVALNEARAAAEPQPQLIAQSLARLAVARDRRGEKEEARSAYYEALELQKELGDRQGQIETLVALGGALGRMGAFADSRDAFQSALELCREMGARGGEADSLNGLGVLAQIRGEMEVAEAYLTDSLAIRRAIGERHGHAVALGNLGMLKGNLGKLSEARAFFEESLALSREIHDEEGIALALANLGQLASLLGDLDAARDYTEESLRSQQARGNLHGEARALYNLGIITAKVGDLAAARQHLHLALKRYEEVDDTIRTAVVRTELAALCVHEDPDAAREWLAHADALLLAMDHAGQRARNSMMRGVCERLHGAREDAERHYREALATLRERGADRDKVVALTELALLTGDDSLIAEALGVVHTTEAVPPRVQFVGGAVLYLLHHRPDEARIAAYCAGCVQADRSLAHWTRHELAEQQALLAALLDEDDLAALLEDGASMPLEKLIKRLSVMWRVQA